MKTLRNRLQIIRDSIARAVARTPMRRPRTRRRCRMAGPSHAEQIEHCRHRVDAMGVALACLSVRQAALLSAEEFEAVADRLEHRCCRLIHQPPRAAPLVDDTWPEAADEAAAAPEPGRGPAEAPPPRRAVAASDTRAPAPLQPAANF